MDGWRSISWAVAQFHEGIANGLNPEWPPPRESLMPDGRITAPGYVYVAPGQRAAQIVPVPMSQLAPQQAAQLAERDAEGRQRRKLPAYLLCAFLGGLGLHRFYLGRKGSALATPLITLLPARASSAC